MKRIHLIIAGLGLIGLSAGCEYHKYPEVRYEAGSLPSGAEDTRSEGATRDAVLPSVEEDAAAEDEVIVPTGDAESPVPEAPSPEAPVSVTPPSDPAVAEAPAPEATAPEAPAVADGDGVVDAEPEPEVGTPLLPPAVSCDEPAFAFVSKRGTREDVYALREGRVEGLTSNNHDFRYFRNLRVKPGSRMLAYDEFFIIHPLLPIPGATISLGDLREPSPAFEAIDAEGILPHGFVWSQDGTKAAYFSHRMERGKTLTDIQVIDAATYEVLNTISVDKFGTKTFGRLAWWGDSLIYDTKFSNLEDSTRELRIVHYQSTGDMHDVVYVKDSGIVFNRNKASDPAVSPTGNVLVYVDSFGGNQLVTCRLSGERVRAYAVYSYPCRDARVLTTVGRVTSPSWSPDGRWIYFSSDRDGNNEIYRIRPDGTGEERLTNDPAQDSSPAPFAPYESCE